MGIRTFESFPLPCRKPMSSAIRNNVSENILKDWLCIIQTLFVYVKIKLSFSELILLEKPHHTLIFEHIFSWNSSRNMSILLNFSFSFTVQNTSDLHKSKGCPVEANALLLACPMISIVVSHINMCQYSDFYLFIIETKNNSEQEITQCKTFQ